MNYFLVLLRWIVLSVFVLLTSCVVYTKPAEPEGPVKHDMIACEMPRPEVCTREFRPVCGLHKDGKYKTYSTACSACTNKQATSYYKGVCK